MDKDIAYTTCIIIHHDEKGPAKQLSLQEPLRKQPTRKKIPTMSSSSTDSSLAAAAASSISSSTTRPVLLNRSASSFQVLPTSRERSLQRKHQETFGHDLDFETASHQLQEENHPYACLVGRTKEQKILWDTVQTVVAAVSLEISSAIVFVHGDQGTGKTTLVHETLMPMHTDKDCLVVWAKNHSEQPCLLFSLLQDLCRKLPERWKESDPSWKELANNMTKDVQKVLVQFMPHLKDVLGRNDIDHDDSRSPRDPLQVASACVKFIRTIVEALPGTCCLVLVLDDLHLADETTMAFIDEIASSFSIPGVILVGLIQDDFSINTPVQTIQERLRDGSKIPVELIRLDNLTLQDVQVFLHRLLLDRPMDDSLALICVRRTGGNPAALRGFLQALHQNALLHFDWLTYQWQWDMDRIKAETFVTPNVLSKLESSLLHSSSKNYQYRLAVAAHLGCSFARDVFDFVWNRMQSHFAAEDDIALDTNRDWLSVVADMGLVEETGRTDNYKWVHPDLQQAATEFLPMDSAAQIKGKMGESLLDFIQEGRPNEESNESSRRLMFAAMDLINSSMGKKNNDDLRIAQLNSVAATKAVEICAFEEAVRYTTFGIHCLPSECWKTQQELALALYSTAVEAEYACGMVQDMTRHYGIVVSQQLPVLDKMRVHNAMIQYLGGTLQFQRSTDLILSLLKELGCTFSNLKLSMGFSALSGVLKAKRRINKMQVEDVLNIERSNSNKTSVVAMLLLKLGQYSYRSSNKLYMPLSLLKGFEFIFDSGITEYSAPAFGALCGLFVILLKDYQLASKCAKMTNLLLDNYPNPETEPRTLMFLNIFGRAWTEPITALESQLLRAYKCGISVGDQENAMLCIWQSLVIGFQTGRSLILLESDLRTYSAQMVQFNRKSVLVYTIGYWLTVVQLMGIEHHVEPLEGVPGHTTLAQWQAQHAEDATIVAILQVLQSHMHVLYGRHTAGAKLALEKGDGYAKANPGHFSIWIDTFCRSLSLYAAAAAMSSSRRRQRIRYIQQANKLQSNLESWNQKGNPNVGHYVLLLQAEAAAATSSQAAAEPLFQSALALAARCGFVSDAALIQERYAHYLGHVAHKARDAALHLQQASDLYKEWGAQSKVVDLEEQRRKILLLDKSVP